MSKKIGFRDFFKKLDKGIDKFLGMEEETSSSGGAPPHSSGRSPRGESTASDPAAHVSHAPPMHQAPRHTPPIRFARPFSTPPHPGGATPTRTTMSPAMPRTTKPSRTVTGPLLSPSQSPFGAQPLSPSVRTTTSAGPQSQPWGSNGATPGSSPLGGSPRDTPPATPVNSHTSLGADLVSLFTPTQTPTPTPTPAPTQTLTEPNPEETEDNTWFAQDDSWDEDVPEPKQDTAQTHTVIATDMDTDTGQPVKGSLAEPQVEVQHTTEKPAAERQPDHRTTKKEDSPLSPRIDGTSSLLRVDQDKERSREAEKEKEENATPLHGTHYEPEIPTKGTGTRGKDLVDSSGVEKEERESAGRQSEGLLKEEENGQAEHRDATALAPQEAFMEEEEEEEERGSALSEGLESRVESPPQDDLAAVQQDGASTSTNPSLPLSSSSPPHANTHAHAHAHAHAPHTEEEPSINERRTTTADSTPPITPHPHTQSPIRHHHPEEKPLQQPSPEEEETVSSSVLNPAQEELDSMLLMTSPTKGTHHEEEKEEVEEVETEMDEDALPSVALRGALLALQAKLEGSQREWSGKEAAWRDRVAAAQAKIQGAEAILHERERQLERSANKLVDLQKESAQQRGEKEQAQREIMDLRSELQRAREASSGNATVESLKEEFSRRLGSEQKKVAALQREREALRKSNAKGEEVAAQLTLKDQRIQQLTSDSEALSRRLTQSEQQIKALQAQAKERQHREDELEGTIRQLRASGDTTNTALESERANSVTLQETISALSTQVAAAQQRTADRTSDIAQCETEITALKEQHTRAEVEWDAERGTLQQALSDLTTEQDRLRHELVKIQRERNQQEVQATQREARLQEQCLDLQRQLQESQEAADRLRDQLTDATTPLLTQLSALQQELASVHSAMESKFQRRVDQQQSEIASLRALCEAESAQAILIRDERDALQQSEQRLKQSIEALTSRATAAEKRCGELEEATAMLRNSERTAVRERDTARQHIAHLSSRVRLLESDASLTLDDNDNVSTCEDAPHAVRHSHPPPQVTGLRLDLIPEVSTHTLSPSLPPRPRSGSISSASNQPLGLQGPDSYISAPPSVSSEYTEGGAQEMSLWPLGNGERTPGGGGGVGSSPLVPDSAHETMQASRLRWVLKQREHDVRYLRKQLEDQRSLQEDLEGRFATLSADADALRVTALQHEELQRQYTDLDQRYLTCLEMIGQKDERVEELQHDIEDLKTAYRQQILLLVGGSSSPGDSDASPPPAPPSDARQSPNGPP